MSSRKKPSLSAHEDAFKRTQLEGEPWRLDTFERQRWVLGYQLLKSTLTDQRLGCSLWCFICNTSRCWTVSLQPLLAARSRCRSCPALVGGQHLVKERKGRLHTGRRLQHTINSWMHGINGMSEHVRTTRLFGKIIMIQRCHPSLTQTSC
jgi:hypothetical protein